MAAGRARSGTHRRDESRAAGRPDYEKLVTGEPANLDISRVGDHDDDFLHAEIQKSPSRR